MAAGTEGKERHAAAPRSRHHRLRRGFPSALGGRRPARPFGFAAAAARRHPVMSHRLSWWPPAAGGVALALACLAWLLLAHAGHARLPLADATLCLALLFVGAAFVCRTLVPNPYVGFLKSIRNTRWAKYDTWLYSPLFLVLGLLIVVQALS
nr:DUF3995 domain-containing protein [Sphingosinicella terrae]